MVFYALTIGRYAVDGDESFVRCEEFGGGGEVWEDEEGDDSPEDGEGAED